MLMDYRRAIEACLQCAEACNQCYIKCIEEESSMVKNCIRIDRECADFCMTAVKAMQSESPFVLEIMQLCERICRACEDECQKHSHDHCQRCAEACRHCAEALHDIAVSL
ncbi:four-helix bundle copper-binding protein [Metabacillus sp. GX 13764]|uniref:four-helix bundle copper-binding protein n=1 Tax=Metabacillus kandeliae TaxID=2900151 RepID=UPI001E3C19D6|nr:four-helix bundle copper-binding protein [Metabacillus kandeliae]MCD7035255.1 four-helix bundle copper-binding protein [Metabacillus kandeliae]